MKAVRWHGKHKVSVENVPDPKIQEPTDAIIKITSTAICGSDLHLYDGLVQTMEDGDILGHEFMGEVVEVGARSQKPESRRPRCGAFHDFVRPLLLLQEHDLFGCATNRIPTAKSPKKFTALRRAQFSVIRTCIGGFAGGQAQYARVPYADVGPIKIPEHLTDEQVLFLSDIFPTGYQAAENCDIQARRYRRDLGRRAGRAIGDSQRVFAGRRARHRRLKTFPNALNWPQQAGAEIDQFPGR